MTFFRSKFFKHSVIGLLAVLLTIAVVLGVIYLETKSFSGELVLSAFAGLIVGGGVVLSQWFSTDAKLARPLDRLTRWLQAAPNSDVAELTSKRLSLPELGELSTAAMQALRKIAEERAAAQNIAEIATADLAYQKSQLEAILQQLDEAVLMCSSQHEILLLNDKARDIFRNYPALGLGRKISRILSPEPLDHALEAMRKSKGRKQTQRVCSSHDGELMLVARLSLIEQDEKEVGYIVTFSDMTEALDAQAEEEKSIIELLEVARRGAANLSTLANVVQMSNDLPVERRQDFYDRLVSEAESFQTRIKGLSEQVENSLVGHWPKERLPLADCLLPLDRMEEIKVECPEEIWADIDSLSLSAFFRELAENLWEEFKSPIEIKPFLDGERVFVAFTWEKGVLSDRLLEGWLSERVKSMTIPMLMSDVLRHHDGAAWPVGAGALHVLVGQSKLPPLSREEARPEFYDFDLVASTDEFNNRKLSDIPMVVFDTETTGLEPNNGDRICQIAAVRVLNGRVLTGEKFDLLVNPGRNIPMASTRVHGITNADVENAPELEQAVARFHSFCEDHVMVAHNIPFDMAFLSHAKGVKFENQVLDTVLLSAYLFDHADDHSLDALATRFGVVFEEGTRHTAIGDALVTAKILVHLLPMLSARGINSWSELTEITAKTTKMRKAQARSIR